MRDRPQTQAAEGVPENLGRVLGAKTANSLGLAVRAHALQMEYYLRVFCALQSPLRVPVQPGTVRETDLFEHFLKDTGLLERQRRL
jgi:hypothetical protein